jgi:hypothetical protein
LKKLIDCNISIITIGDDKIPNYPWKKYQSEVISKEKLESQYNHQTDTTYEYKGETKTLKATKGLGIVTGYNDLECIDIDLKVIKSLKEQQDFWNEYLNFLKDNIDDFDNKFVIYKTINNGFHIIYRCKTIGGNQKIAKLKGQTESVLETRGKGGYIFIYENQISKLSYTEIKEISEIDRSVLMDISKIYNYVEEEIKPEIKIKEYPENKLTPWNDFNAKTSIFDIVGTDFKIVRTLSDKYIIKRDGGTSAHSGYVYKNSNCMYLFTTATQYPHEKLITPYLAYTIKYFNNDFKSSAVDLYNKGFGDRVVKAPKEIKEKPILNTKDLVFPIDIFPESIQNYILQCNKTLDSSIDYMGCSFLWLSSVIIGNSLNIKVKNGWVENGTLWLSIVGKAGLGKTPSISNIIFPLMKANNRQIKDFIKQNDKYQAYKNLEKAEQKKTEEIKRPLKTQFIVNDITLEALVDLHEESDNSVGVFKDELAGWFKDMNKYRAGSDLEFWLSSWSGKSVSLNRKTAKSAFVEKPFIPVLGGIQPSILNIFYTDENKDNGFIDRMLLSYPELEIDSYNENEMPQEVIEWYSSSIIGFYDAVKKQIVKRNIEQEIDPQIASFTIDAKNEWKRIFNEITTVQNSDSENEYMKSMLPKQKSYIPRFALIINTINCFFNDKHHILEISKESILKAEKLSKYFIAMAKKIKINTVEVSDIRASLEVNKLKTDKEKFTILFKENNNLNKKEVADMLGISRQSVYNYIKEIENGK